MEAFKGTCSAEKPRAGCLTFIRSQKYLHPLITSGISLTCLIDKKVYEEVRFTLFLPPQIEFIPSEYVDYDFTVIHNRMYSERFLPDADKIQGIFHPSAQIDEGIHVALGPEGTRLQLKHMGNVVCEPGSRVGPLTFIQRASLPGCSTIIKAGALVDGYCTIGHNAVIGEESLVAAGSVVGAGSVIGKNCLLGIHTIVKPHTKICDRVVIGIGSVVIKDIDKPGIYFGAPAVFKKEHPEGWMW